MATKRQTNKNQNGAGWGDDIHKVLRDVNVRQVAYVPDAGHTRLIDLCQGDNLMRAVPLTTEEEGIAMLSGAWLGGDRGALLMQSSGVGNCINMLSIMQECRFPLLALITMRGEWGEFNPWQVPMGEGTRTVLETAGVVVRNVENAADIGETVFAASQLAFNAYRPVAVVIGQRVIGFKDWRK